MMDRNPNDHRDWCLNWAGTCPQHCGHCLPTRPLTKRRSGTAPVKSSAKADAVVGVLFIGGATLILTFLIGMALLKYL